MPPWFRLAGLASAVALGGCYTYTPVATGTTPAVGESVALDITDTGRVGLAERFGPGLLRVEGRLTSATSDYALNVHRVGFIGAPASRWSGEAVRIDRAFVGTVRQRTLSRGRTALAAGAVAVVIGVAFSTDLIGLFSGTNGRPPPDPDPESNRVLGIRIAR